MENEIRHLTKKIANSCERLKLSNFYDARAYLSIKTENGFSALYIVWIALLITEKTREQISVFSGY